MPFPFSSDEGPLAPRPRVVLVLSRARVLVHVVVMTQNMRAVVNLALNLARALNPPRPRKGPDLPRPRKGPDLPRPGDGLNPDPSPNRRPEENPPLGLDPNPGPSPGHAPDHKA